MSDLGEWVYDPEHQTLDLKLQLPAGELWAWIAARPLYCDRGHWQFGVMHAPFFLDHADGFPRYFMDLQTALQEAERWLRWRIANYTPRRDFPPELATASGRPFGLDPK